MSLTLYRYGAVGQKHNLTDRTAAAAPLPGSSGVLAKLIALNTQRNVRFNVFDRIIAGIGVEHVDRVQPVATVASAIAAREQLNLNPEIVALLAGQNHAAAVAASVANLTRHCFRKGLHDRIRKLDASAKPGNDRRRKNRVCQRARRSDDFDRTE